MNERQYGQLLRNRGLGRARALFQSPRDNAILRDAARVVRNTEDIVQALANLVDAEQLRALRVRAVRDRIVWIETENAALAGRLRARVKPLAAGLARRVPGVEQVRIVRTGERNECEYGHS